MNNTITRYTVNGEEYDVRPDVLNYDDIARMVPALKGHRRLVEAVMKLLKLDQVNRTHGFCCTTPGPDFVRRLLFEDLRVNLKIDNEQELDHLPQGAFITVSNHPLGAVDGITLIYLITRHRPKYRVMVNEILNKISGMSPNFIAVDALQSDDPVKRRVSVNGIRQAMRLLKDGEPLGFFPAGAISKLDRHGNLEDRQWQPTVLQLIYKAKVPVIPIYFHTRNSAWFNLLGLISWQLRTLRLPAEVFNKRGKTIHVSIGDPISVEKQSEFGSAEELGAYLREQTYKLRGQYGKK